MPREDDETEQTQLPGAAGGAIATPLKRDRAYLTVIAGQNVGEMYMVGGGLVIGRGSDTDVRVTDDEMSRRHARIAVRGREITVEDLGAKNGTFVNGTRIRKAILADGDKIQLGSATVMRFSFQDHLEESFQRQMYESALRDPLTRAYNRKYMIDRLQSEIAYAIRHETPLSLLLFDVDHFKKVNDTYGHLAGDSVLAGLARHVLRIIRTEDVFARYGGEEFAVMSRGIALDAARKFGERLRSAVQTYPFIHEGTRIGVTVSVGVSGVPGSGATNATELLALADKALYAAKEAGRNRVCVA